MSRALYDPLVEKKQTRRIDGRVLFGVMMGIGSLAAGAVRMHLFEAGIDWFFWSMVAVALLGAGMVFRYAGRRRLHAQTRTFIERPERKPAAAHHEADHNQ